MTLRLVLVVMVLDVALSAQSGGPSRPASPSAGAPGTVAASRSSPPTAAGATLRGRVTSADDGRPVRGADLTLFPSPLQDGGRPYTAYSDDNGAYEFTKVIPRQYVLSISKSGFVQAAYGQATIRGPIPPLELKPGEVRSRADVALLRGGAITGRIVDETGEPVAGAQVSVMRTVVDDWQPSLRGEGQPSVTDGAGRFRVFGLPPGRYFVSATAMSVLLRAQRRPGYVPTFYPGTEVATPAGAVSIAGGEEATGIDFAISPTPSGSISGRVIAPQSAGQMVIVSLSRQPQSGEPASPTMGVRSEVQLGNTGFAFNAVPSGSYVISATAYGSDGKESFFAEEPVVLEGARALRDIVINLSQGSSVRGRLKYESATKRTPDLSQLKVSLQSPDPTRRVTSVSASLEADGTFVWNSVVSSRVLFRVQAPGWMLQQVTINGLDVTDVPIDLPAAPLDGVEVVLTDRLSHITGAVITGRGTPAGRVSVVAFADDSTRWSRGTRFIGRTESDSQSRFSIDGLPAGSYRVIAVPDLERGMETDRQMLDTWHAAAVQVIVRDGVSHEVTLRIQP